MKITVAGIDIKRPRSFKLHREHGRSDYLFVLFKSPSEVLTNGSYTPADKGMCIFFDKNKIQSYFPSGKNEFVHDYMHFDFETDFENLLFSDIPTGQIINISDPDCITAALSAIRDELLSHSAHKNEILTNLGHIFLYRIKDELSISDADKKKTVFRNLYELRTKIYKSPQSDWSIGNICREICMSESYLKHRYKEFFGVSCIDDVINAKTEAAKSLLISSNYKISEIAEKCGYKNTEHFIRQFKKRTGMSPGTFRNE